MSWDAILKLKSIKTTSWNLSFSFQTRLPANIYFYMQHVLKITEIFPDKNHPTLKKTSIPSPKPDCPAERIHAILPWPQKNAPGKKREGDL